MWTGFGWMTGFIGLFDTAHDYTLQFTVTHTHTHTHARTHTLVSTVSTSSCLVAASNSRRSPSSGFLNYPRPQLPASHSNSSQWLNPISPLTKSLTCPIITSQHRMRRKHRFSLFLYPLVAVEFLRSCLLVEPLPSSGCCVVTYFTFIA
jgi:hypothetical protein